MALAHLFAFRLSARLVGSGAVDLRDVRVSLAQLAGAAVLCTVPVLPLPTTAKLDAVRLVLAGFIALVAYLTARSNETSRRRALFYAAFVLVIALAIAVTKNVLAGH